MFGGPQASRAPATPAAGGPHPSQMPDTPAADAPQPSRAPAKPAAGGPQPSRAPATPADGPKPRFSFAAMMTQLMELRLRDTEFDALDALNAMKSFTAGAVDSGGATTDDGDMNNCPSATEAEDEEGPQPPPPMLTTASADTHGGGELPTEDADTGDRGCYGLYIANWGGNRGSRLLNEHINAGAISRNLGSIIVASEVNDEFIESLLDPAVKSRRITRGGGE